MRQFQRLIACSMCAAGVGGIGAAAYLSTPVASAGTRALAPAPATIATCDVYLLTERLVDSDAYAPARASEQELIRTQLAPTETELSNLERELGNMQKELQAADPQDPAAQAKYQTFTQKRNEFQQRSETYGQRRQDLMDKYSELVANQFAQAHGRVAAELRKVADARGYTHVFAQKTGEIKAREPRQLVEEFLSRPITIAPPESDLTEAVRLAMNLPDKPANPAGAGSLAPGGEGTTPASPPASPKP